MIDKKTFLLGVLSLSALLLLLANMMLPHYVRAADTIKDRDYQLVTGRVSTPGGEALYITDNHTGQMAAIVFDPNSKALRVADVRPVMAAFPPPRK